MLKLSDRQIRLSARNKDCTVNIPGVCNYAPETTVYAHATRLPPTGIIGGKHPDFLGGYYACSSCHDAMDGRNSKAVRKEDKLFYEYRAVIKTWRKIFQKIKS